eukprot:2152911-Prymnesium_polylepis.1
MNGRSRPRAEASGQLVVFWSPSTHGEKQARGGDRVSGFTRTDVRCVGEMATSPVFDFVKNESENVCQKPCHVSRRSLSWVVSHEIRGSSAFIAGP